MHKLSRAEAERYARQMALKQWAGEEGQLKLKASKVVLVGVGAVGSAAAQYLVSAGVGRVDLCDGDAVSREDLGRQILYAGDDVGKNKAELAACTLSRLNDEIEIVAHAAFVSEANARALFSDADLICCAADESEAKRVVGRHAFDLGIPLVMGGTTHMAGSVTFIDPPASPCIECILASSDRVKEDVRAGRMEMPEESRHLVEDAKPVPMLGASSGVAGSLLAMECIKFIVGFGVNLIGMMLQYDLQGAGMSFNLYDIDSLREGGCPCCGSESV